MKPQRYWHPLRSTGVPGRTVGSMRAIRVSEPGQPAYGLVTASVTREGGMYHVEVFTYTFGADGIVDTESQRRIESGLETSLNEARLRGEQAAGRGWAELRAAHLQEVAR